MVVAEKKELVQFLLRIYNGPHAVNFTAKFRLQCMKCLLLFPLCKPLRVLDPPTSRPYILLRPAPNPTDIHFYVLCKDISKELG